MSERDENLRALTERWHKMTQEWAYGVGPDCVEIEDDGCRCGECIPCKLREFVRKAEEEAQRRPQISGRRD